MQDVRAAERCSLAVREGFLPDFSFTLDHRQAKATWFPVDDQFGDACNLPDRGALVDQFRAGDGWSSLQLNLTQVAMDVSAGSNALNDLLAEIAPLAEVKRPD